MSRYYEKKDGNDKKSAIRRRRELVMRDEEDFASVHDAIQPKLEISQPEDVQEKEADLVAKNVVQGSTFNVPGSVSASGISTKSEGDSTLYADDKLQRQLDSSKGSGQAMDDATKSEMETKMGADFSGVKIHTDSAAHAMSEDINAKAFTHGQDIYFKSLQYDPKGNAGKELLAHELWHTRQNGGGKFGNPVARKILRAQELPIKDVPTGLFYRKSVMDEIRTAIAEKWNGIDDSAAKLTDSEMSLLSLFDRKELINQMLDQYFWYDEDDQSVIRAIRTTPTADRYAMVLFLSAIRESGTNRYSEIKNRINSDYLKDLYAATTAIGYTDQAKITELENLVNSNDSDVDSTAALLTDTEILKLSLLLRLKLINQIGVKDYYVDEEDSRTLIRLVQLVPNHYIDDKTKPLSDKQQIADQWTFRRMMHPKGDSSIYEKVKNSISAKYTKEFIAAIFHLYPDAEKTQESEFRKDMRNPLNAITDFFSQDDKINELTDDSIRYMSSVDREIAIGRLIGDFVLDDEDEKNLIRLVSLFSSNKDRQQAQKDALAEYLLKNDWAVLKELQDEMEGENIETMRAALDEVIGTTKSMGQAMHDAIENGDWDTEDMAMYLGPTMLKHLSPQDRFDLMLKIADGWWTGGTDEETILRIMESFVIDEKDRSDYLRLKDKTELNYEEQAIKEQVAYVEFREKDRLELMKLFEDNSDAKSDIEGAIEGDNDTKFQRIYASIDIEGRDDRLLNAANLWLPWFDRDEAVAMLSEEDLKQLSISKRVEYIDNIAGGGWWPTIVGDEDESSLVLLINTVTNPTDAKVLMLMLSKDNGELEQRLEKVIHGEEYKEFHQALRYIYNLVNQSDLLVSNGQSNQKKIDAKTDQLNSMLQMGVNHPNVFPWKDPGILKRIYTTSYEYTVEWKDSKLKVSYYEKPINVLSGLGMKGVGIQKGPFDPFETVGILYMMNEKETGGQENVIDFVPAITLLQLQNKQYKHTAMDLANVGMLVIGAVSIATGNLEGAPLFFAALDVAMTSVSLVIDSYEEEILNLPGGSELLGEINKQFIIGGIAGGLYLLAQPSVLNRIKDMWTGMSKYATLGLKEAMLLRFFRPAEISGEIMSRINAIKNEAELGEVNSYLLKLEEDGKITAEARKKWAQAAGKRLDREMGFGAFSDFDAIDYVPAGKVIGQMRENSCVSAAARMLMEKGDDIIPEAYLRSATNLDNGGASLSNAPEAIEEVGIQFGLKIPKYEFAEGLKIGDLKKCVEKGPVIVSIKTPKMQGYRHAVVVDDISGTRVFIRDPYPDGVGSSYSISIDDFVSSWEDAGKVVFPK